MNYTLKEKIEKSNFFEARTIYYKENKDYYVHYFHRLDGPAIEYLNKEYSYFNSYYIAGIAIPKEDYEKAVEKYIKEQIFK